MMALTRQFNLSETTFLLPPSDRLGRGRSPAPDLHADPRPAARRDAVRRPSRRSAARTCCGPCSACGDAVNFELPAGRVPVDAAGDIWTLTAPFDGKPSVHPEAMPAQQVAAMLGLDADDLAGPPVWVDTGMEQLLVPVRTPAPCARRLLRPRDLDGLAAQPQRPAQRLRLRLLGEDASKAAAR